MALLKTLDQVFTKPAGVGKHANINIIMTHDKTMWVNRIVKLWNCCDDQVANGNGLVRLKCMDRIVLS